MLSLLAQTTTETDLDGGSAIFGGVGIIVYLVILVLLLVSLWKVFEKMGQPGWFGIIPIFNYCVIAKLGGKDWWWGLLVIVPCIGWIFGIILLNELSKLFGKSVGYTVGLIFLPFIFLPMLAFGSAQYQGPQQKAF